jgi:hypothetical protein
VPTTARRGASSLEEELGEDVVSDIQAPVDEKQTSRYRAARLLVIVLSALIILAVMALVVGGVMQMTGHSTKLFGSSKPAPPGASAPAEAFVLPPGAKVVKTESQPGRLILHVHSDAGDEIDIVDTADGHLISRIGPASSP